MIGSLEFVSFDDVMSASYTDISSCAVCNCLYRGRYVMPYMFVGVSVSGGGIP